MSDEKNDKTTAQELTPEQLEAVAGGLGRKDLIEAWADHAPKVDPSNNLIQKFEGGDK